MTEEEVYIQIGLAIEDAARDLPEGYLLDIQIEKHGYDVGLITKNGRLQVDGGDGFICDLQEALIIAIELEKGG